LKSSKRSAEGANIANKLGKDVFNRYLHVRQ